MADPELVSALYVFNLGQWMDVAMDALSIYEFSATFDQEISSVWARKRSGASFLLFAVRYTMLFTAIADLASTGDVGSKACKGTLIAGKALVLLGFVVTAAFSALRVYALYGTSARSSSAISVGLSALVFLLQLSPVAVNLYATAKTTIAVYPLFGCGASVEIDSKTREALVYASRIPLSIGDALVVAVTWAKSFNQLRMQRSLGIQFSLSTLMFRDGTVYFILLLILNVLEMTPLTSTTGGQVVASLSAVLPPILINRFMLNLRQVGEFEGRSAGHSIRSITTPVFRFSVDIAGNMGESLEYGWEARGSDEFEMEEMPREAEYAGLSEHRQLEGQLDN